jgi:sugar lactone lactonase YvrE
MAEIEIIDVPKDDHGEGPIWLQGEQALVWIDVYNEPSIQRLDVATGAYSTLAMPRITACLAPRHQGGFLAGMEGGFFIVDGDGQTTLLCDPATPDGQEQLNDGKCDSRGRFWCASLIRDMKTPRGRLIRVDPDGNGRSWDEGYLTGNGVAFSPDYERLYVADSRAETIWLYDFDDAAGTIHNRRQFFSTAGMPGRPDGASVDSEGNYWVALIQGAAVIAIDPNGVVVEKIELPVEYPTMCAFGGPANDILYITSSRLSLDEEARKRHPDAGSVIAVHGTGARGLPVAGFGG